MEDLVGEQVLKGQANPRLDGRDLVEARYPVEQELLDDGPPLLEPVIVDEPFKEGGLFLLL